MFAVRADLGPKGNWKMITEWTNQEHQLRVLTAQARRYLTTFRWLWLLNLAGAGAGLATHHYALTIVTAGLSLVALIGAALARRGRTTVSEVAVECDRLRHVAELPQ